ncbi:alpha/beta hydrolase [Pseudacidovorax intermedius]|uniref:alpha/beta hydrolase n=1 Tax=Pseudacidovorax intermedius TaxID=433924 RepID=UPI0026F2F05A|nr:alpha/beta hydrolase [Pseudacidovorax intermedius]
MKDDALDPDLKAMLQAAAAATGGPSIRELPIPMARAAYRERYLARGLRPPEREVTMTEQVLALPDRELPARLYRPASMPEGKPAPLVIYFHGGGFVVGDPAAYDHQSRWIADRLGVAVLVPDYRLAPEHPFPAAVDDAWDVFQAVAGAPDSWGADPTRIALAGDSAGGCLTLVTALRAAGERAGPQPAACLSLYPVTDYTDRCGEVWPSITAFGKGYFLDQVMLDWFADLYFLRSEDALAPQASPLRWPSVAGLPPVVIVTAGYDPLRDQGDAMAQRLAGAGGVVEHVQLPDMIHNFPGYAGLSAGAATAFAQVVDRLGVHLQRR